MVSLCPMPMKYFVALSLAMFIIDDVTWLYDKVDKWLEEAGI